MTTNRQRIIESSRERRLLLASGWGPWAKEGALFSYGPDLNAMTRRAASYVDISKHAGRVNDESILVDEIAA